MPGLLLARPLAMQARNFSMVALILAILAPSGAWGRDYITYYNGNVSVPTYGQHAPSVITNGGTFATGRAAEIFAEGGGHRGSRSDSPARRAAPRRLASPKRSSPVASEPAHGYQGIPSGGKIIAGMYEIEPGVFVFSRHALQGNPDFAKQLEGFRLFEARNPLNGHQLDLVIAMKKGQPVSRALSQLDDVSCRVESSGIGGPFFQLRDAKELAGALALGQEFQSRHVSTVGATPVEQVIQGKIAHVAITLTPKESPFVDAFLDENTGPGSSGGVIYVKERGQFKVGGVIACHVTPISLALKNNSTLGGTRLITIQAMKASILRPIEAENIASEPPANGADGCSPVDNRGAGGF